MNSLQYFKNNICIILIVLLYYCFYFFCGEKSFPEKSKRGLIPIGRFFLADFIIVWPKKKKIKHTTMENALKNLISTVKDPSGRNDLENEMKSFSRLFQRYCFIIPTRTLKKHNETTNYRYFSNDFFLSFDHTLIC